MSSKVLLPAPDGPIIADNSPARNSPLTPFNTYLFSVAEKEMRQNQIIRILESLCEQIQHCRQQFWSVGK